MYRLLKVRSVGLQNAYKMPSIQDSPRFCLYCNLYHQHKSKSFNLLQLRHFSTMDPAILSSIEKRKIKRKTKKYAELLEVTDSTTSSKKALVQNLNAAQLSILVDQPNITLDRLHKIKNEIIPKKRKKENKLFSVYLDNDALKDPFSTIMESSFSKSNDSFNVDSTKNLKEQALMENESDENTIVEELESSGITDETVLIKSSSFADSLYDCELNKSINKEPSVKKDKINRKKEKKIDLQNPEDFEFIEEKLKQFNKVLLGYINVCVNSKNSAYGTYIIFGLKKKKSMKPGSLYINNTYVYNAQLEKLAADCDTKNLFALTELMRKENVKYNHQTYAYIFYCVAKMNLEDADKLALLKKIEKEMTSDNISLNDVWTKSFYIFDERSLVEKMVKLLNDRFEPTYEFPDISYDCRLLENFSKNNGTPSSTVYGLLNKIDLKDRLEKQIQMEIDGQVTVQNIVKPKVSKESLDYWRKKLSNLEKTWENMACQSFKRNLTTLIKREKFLSQKKMKLHPYLSILEPKDYIRILMAEVRRLSMGSEMYSLPYQALCREIGIQVYKMYEAKLKQNNGVNDKMSEIYLQYCDWFLNRNNNLNCRENWTLLEREANKTGTSSTVEVPSWQGNIHTSIGRFLFDIIISDLKIDQNIFKKKKHGGHPRYIQAFFKVFRHSGVKLKEEVKPNPIVAKLYRNSHPETLTFDTTLVPSVCPPRPWVSPFNGGYIVSKTNLVRMSMLGSQHWDRLVTAAPKKLYPSLDSLNQLGSIPWSVNERVLDVAIEVFRNDGSVELNMPQPPTVLPPIQIPSKNLSAEEKRKIYKERTEQKRRKNEMYSLWCDALYRLSLANHFRDKIFWLPHNMDFRGRVYPIPPHLTHLGSDLARSILIFALKKPLGPDGLDWLKLHAINLTGLKKKESVNARLNYANEILDDILDSAENPLTGRMWWSKSDDPWQTLATCMEIAAALKSPNPAEFMSGFPIHQDGSCNGLQHYAALGRDKIGAKSVNLCPSERPQDVYSSVAAMVDERRKEDAANGNQIAKILDGFITRKVIKQTVMTTVYGVTWFGAKLQIARQLKDLDDFPQEYLWPASVYLVAKTFQTLRTMFKSAREIQDWLTECCRLVCMSRNQNMEWMTPLGLPVVQPYSKKVNQGKEMQKSLSPLYSTDIFRKPNVVKQKNAFAPNFIHSLDSSHMMLTSIHCENAGITFISVHDCYWTHPCTADDMNKICREQFLALHSEPILQDLSEFLIKKFTLDNSNPNEDLNDADKSIKQMIKSKLRTTLNRVPDQGDFDLKVVLKSRYFFS